MKFIGRVSLFCVIGITSFMIGIYEVKDVDHNGETDKLYEYRRN